MAQTSGAVLGHAVIAIIILLLRIVFSLYFYVLKPLSEVLF